MRVSVTATAGQLPSWSLSSFRPGQFAVLASLISPLLLLVAWSLVARAHWFPEQILVPPEDVLAAFRDLYASGDLQSNLQISLYRLLTGFSVGALIGLTFGVGLALSETVQVYFGPLFNALRQVPTLALIPMLVMILGIGESLKIVILIKVTFFPVALATSEGIKNIPRAYLEVGRVFRLGSWTLFRCVVLPAALPEVLTGVRVALGRSWMVLIAVELLAADSGIGQMMEMGRQMLRLDQVMVGVIITGMIGFILDGLLRSIERLSSRWRPRHG
jgi:sulfonate transport system permease protein